MHTALELLAPAKDLQTGIAAITHGADAVYIAADKFGAREKAGNSIEDIKELVSFAHQYFARVYVTVNTILYENELDDARKLIFELHQAKVDSIIIQDFAILSMDIPPIAIHASTQMHNNSIEKLRFLESCGIERVVLPRELSIQEIRDIKKSTNAELEFFIHGALCVCYSGQCYMSQAITGRSANRGACAQPCRSSYNLIDADGKVLVKNKHLLSLKDLNLSQHIFQLIDSGITSFKIEGRLKDISYVKNTVAFYSSLINSIISVKPEYKRLSSGKCNYFFEPDLERTFNRGFTTHFIDGRTSNQASYHSQKSIGKLIGRVLKLYPDGFTLETSETILNGDGICYYNSKGELKGFQVNTSVSGKICPNQMPDDIVPGTILYRNSDTAFEKTLSGESAKRFIHTLLIVEQKNNQFTFSITDEDSIQATTIVDDNFEAAKKPILAINNLTNQLSKTGETIFRIDQIDVSSIHTPKHIQISTINAIRRDLLEKLKMQRLAHYKPNTRDVQDHSTKYPLQKLDFKGNISNSMSKTFLKNHGVLKIDEAFEIDIPNNAVELMTTRYCIKYELNMCPAKQGAIPSKQLFIQDNQNTYPLVFDCKKCQMKIMSPHNKTKL